MKRNQALSLGLIFLLIFGTYVGYCLQAFFVKPPLDFGELINSNEQEVIYDWYRKTSEISSTPFNFRTLTYALSHPHSPHLYHPSVTLGGLGGEGSIQVSFGNYVAIFSGEESGLHFEYDDHAD